MNHLSLEQCKKLEELGFPQDGCDFYWIDYRRETRPPYLAYRTPEETYSALRVAEEFACPTLDELLDWLQNDYANDINMHNLQLSQVWNKHEWEVHIETAELKCLGCGYGVTPLEAVYELAVAVKGA